MSVAFEQGEIVCVSHQQPVALASKDVWVRHQDGGYCDSGQFTIGVLTRAQAIGLLLVARGEAIVNSR